MKSHKPIGYARTFVTLFAVVVVAVVSNPSIFNDIASGQTEDTSVCARTPGIREAIVAAVILSGAEGVDGCEDVTDDHLATITGLPDTRLDQNLLRTAPKSFDLHGLSKLQSLYLANHSLGSLPTGFFSENPAMALWIFRLRNSRRCRRVCSIT